MRRRLKILLAGKPNSGKSSLFNQLTGLRQKTGNFPGVTVDKRVGRCRLDLFTEAEIIDLPGVYSLYPRSVDEKIVANILLDRKNPYFPDIVLLVADAANLQSSLLLTLQLIDLGFPVVLALNMIDTAVRLGKQIDIEELSHLLDIPIVPISARQGEGVKQIKKTLCTALRPSSKKNYCVEREAAPLVNAVQRRFDLPVAYHAFQYVQQESHLNFLSATEKKYLSEEIDHSQLDVGGLQTRETLSRYRFIQRIVDKITCIDLPETPRIGSQKIDKLLTHKVFGYVIFLLALLLVFQAVFSWAQPPMEWIDQGFAALSAALEQALPQGRLLDLITKGILPGIGGIVIFVPQIAILFLFISILEETGYMARVIFLMDNMMQRFGMHGKSVVPLISGWACAIPAIMATRTIENRRDRLITLFVTPLMSCSARLPVYTILIALMVSPNQQIGFLNMQGLFLMGLYLLGFAAALLSAWAMKKIMKEEAHNLLMIELPLYRMPRWPNVGMVILEKTKTFVLNAGKVILAISILLWALASYGPNGQMDKAEVVVAAQVEQGLLSSADAEAQRQAYRLEHSYAGIMGKAIEPLIAPLGYDWKIGIALISSFAAREVFVGAIATLYSLGSATDDPTTITERLRKEKNRHTGNPQFNPATVISLLLFYTFAMQCMSTLAVVKRETKGWKWPLIQFMYMTVLAYISAWAGYQVAA